MKVRIAKTHGGSPSDLADGEGPDPGDEHFARGDWFRDRKDWNNAAEAYSAGLASDPSAFAMWVQYGHALKESGRLHEAGQAYLKAEEIDRNDSDLCVQLGHLNKIFGNISACKNYYRRAVELGSKDDHAMEMIQPVVGVEVRDLLYKMYPDGGVQNSILKAWLWSDSFAQIMLSTADAASEIASERE